MNQYTFLRARGFAPPFQADERCRGSVTDAAGKLVPILVLPSLDSESCRLTLARSIADNLNREAAERQNRGAA